MYVYILRSKCGKTPEMFSIKRVPLVILARKEIEIVASVRWQQQTRYMCIFFVLKSVWKITSNGFYKKRAVRNELEEN